MRVFAIAMTSLIAVAAASPAAAEGFRAEIHGGWDHVSANDMGDDGIVYGIGLGYDMAVGQNAFVGIDLSLDDSSVEECEIGALAANDELCLKAGRDIAAGIRGGFKVGETGKAYALAGYTNARVKSVYTTPAGVTTDEGANLDGFRLGAGYEHGFGGNAYGKVEYRYSNYEADFSRHQLLFGIGLNF